MPNRLMTGAALAAALTTAVVAVAPSAASAAPGAVPGAVTAATAATSAAVASSGDALRQAEQGRAAAVARSVGLTPGEALTVRGVVVDPDGTRHVRYDRTLDGLRVVGGDLVVARSRAGAVTAQHRANPATLALASRTPRVGAAAAKALAASRAGYAVDSSAAALVVYAVQGAPRLAWEVTTTGVRPTQTPSRLRTFVDARTGRLLDRIEEIHEGTGNTQYSGAVPLNTTAVAINSYRLRDSVNNYTTNLNRGTSGAGTEYTDTDDIWGTGLPANTQTAAADAQWGAQVTYGYYLSAHNRAGIWNTGKGARSRVHYGNGYVNAFWDGTQMTYGDGAGNARPLTQVDVAAHEMTHGVTQNTAGLLYRGESGGLNEATSDIFGTAVEWYANTTADQGDYLIGEKININGNGTPLRYMDRPSRDGRSRDCWSSTLGRIDVHYSSGPLNHWYYLVAEGSGAKTVNGVAYNSPLCNSAPAVTGVGRTVAERVWYRTLTTKLTSSSGYAAARNGAIASAKELYGRNTAQCLAVEKAFTAIAVPKGAQTCAN
ncbi:M4 family metallopeptidase [Oryzobacter terrae]|uniref:M4 family metallopeptidase n=1 Tax=Oryzobacter terrae TaxID=1620385 RepID=UPI00367146AF